MKTSCSMTRRLARWTGLLALCALQGCATREPDAGSPRFPPGMDARIQVCVPGARVYFKEIVLDHLDRSSFPKFSEEEWRRAPRALRRVEYSDNPKSNSKYMIPGWDVRNDEGVRSAGSVIFDMRDATVSNQPVYESGILESARSYIALSVSLKDPATGKFVDYWFTLPDAIAEGKFTPWLNPVFVERDDEKKDPHTWYRVINGQKLTPGPVPADAPKMRVSLQKKRKEPYNDLFSPALSAARLQNRETDVYEFVPAADETISACD